MQQVQLSQYLSYKIVAVQKEGMGIGSLIKITSGKNTSATDCTHCIHIANSCSGNIDINHINENVYNNIDEQIKKIIH
jgi:hypothetical protein